MLVDLRLTPEYNFFKKFINFVAFTKLVQKITKMYHYIKQLQLQVSLDGVT